MANLISRVTGNWLTASTWGLVDTTSLLISRASNAVVPTSAGSTARSSAFTPGAITIDGIAINIANRTGTTGTMTVELWNNTGSAVVSGTTVTINVSDLPAFTTASNDSGWTVFAFSSVALSAATDYMVQITTSSSTQVSVFANATTNNWSRLLRTTTTQAPAAGDDMVVAGELTGAGTSNSYTVTMNSTSATDYGSGVADGSSITPALCVSCNGTLTFGTAAATNYILRLSGNLANARTGTINVGTTGTPIPRDSTAVVEFDCAADADFGWHNHGGTCNIQGLSRTSGKNVEKCLLDTDEAVGQTVLGVDTDTGWLSGDQIVIATTSRTLDQSELRTLASNASATELTITAGLTYAHSGTAPTQAEVINLTRNVKIRSVSSTAMTFMHNNQTAVVDIDWAEVYYMGAEVAVVDWRGVTVTTTTGDFNMQHCSLHDFDDHGFYVAGTAVNNFVFSHNVTWKLNSSPVDGTQGGVTTAQPSSGTNWTMDDNYILTDASGSNSAGLILSDIGGVITNNHVASHAIGAKYLESNGVFGTFTGQVYHTNAKGAQFYQNNFSGVYANVTIWRSSNIGIEVLNGGNRLTFDGGTAFGNLQGLVFLQSTSAHSVLTFRNFSFSGDTSFASQYGIGTPGSEDSVSIVLDNCTFGVASGIRVAHTVADINVQTSTVQLEVLARNTTFASSVEVLTQSNLSDEAFISSQRHDQTSGNHKTWLRNGTLATDAVIYNTASPSMRMTPINATGKLESAALFRGLKVAVNNGGTVTINVYTRKSTAGDGAAYNGAQPRLIVKANPALGSNFNSDTVLDTHTAAAGTWEQLSGTTASVTDDGVLELVVDCDGTVGWINVDDWSKS